MIRINASDRAAPSLGAHAGALLPSRPREHVDACVGARAHARASARHAGARVCADAHVNAYAVIR